MSRKVAVIIPIYRRVPTRTEQKSLAQCLKILGTHPIIFFCAHSFDYAHYQAITGEYGITFTKITFDDAYFESKKGYNSLCLSTHFYRAFAEFEYILIYQLDAWVFRDELIDWCALGYDYIGAPFPVDFQANHEDVVFSTVGNGGFSLRKVSSILALFKPYKRIKNLTQLLTDYADLLRKNVLYYPYLFIRLAGFHNTVSHLRKGDIWEDHFFSEVARLSTYFKVPSATIALAFSFEYRPSAAFSKTENKLPFGCHGWDWIEYDQFWHLYIK